MAQTRRTVLQASVGVVALSTTQAAMAGAYPGMLS